MTQEISDAIKEQEFKKAAVAIIKSNHHHDDGSDVNISELEKSGIETKIIESEEEWKLKTAEHKVTSELSDSELKKPKQDLEDKEQDVVPLQPKKKEFIGNCTCGALFATTTGKDGSVGPEIKIKSYDASGNATATYSAQGSQPESYSASGNPSEDYVKQ